MTPKEEAGLVNPRQLKCSVFIRELDCLRLRFFNCRFTKETNTSTKTNENLPDQVVSAIGHVHHCIILPRQALGEFKEHLVK